MYCPECGTQTEEKDNYCGECGYAVSTRIVSDKKTRFHMMKGDDRYISYLQTVILLCIIFYALQYTCYFLLGAAPVKGFVAGIQNVSYLLQGSEMTTDDIWTIVQGVLLNLVQGYQNGIGWKGMFLGGVIGVCGIGLKGLLFFAGWRMFEKADIPGWKLLIPVYNVFCIFKLVFGNGWTVLLPIGFLLMMLLPDGGIVFGIFFLIVFILVFAYNIKELQRDALL